jgi:hypothetical protein
MSWRDANSDSANSDGLDDLLEKAAWPEPTTEQLDRLRARWRRTVVVRRVRIVGSVVGCAAILLVGFVAAVNLSRANNAAGLPNAAAPQVANQDRTLGGQDAELVADELLEPATSTSRAPTVYEQTLLAVRIAERGQQPREPSADMVAVSPGANSKVTDERATEPNAAGPDVMGANIEELFKAMSSTRVAVRLDAAKALAALHDPKVSQRMARMAMQNVNRREALVGLVRSRDPVAREFLQFAESNAELAALVHAVAARFAVQTPPGGSSKIENRSSNEIRVGSSSRDVDQSESEEQIFLESIHEHEALAVV